MYLNGEQTKLKTGDVALFRSKDRVVQFLRKGQRLTNQYGDDKSIVSNVKDLIESECFQIVQIIAETHGFIIKNESDLCGGSECFRFVFVRNKSKSKSKKKFKEEDSKVKFVMRIRFPKKKWLTNPAD